VSATAQGPHLTECDATRILSHLAEAGYLEAISEPMGAPSASPAARLQAIAGGMNHLLRLIAGAVASAGGLDPFLAGARSFLADGASRFAPLWQLVPPGRDGTLDADAVLGNLASLGGAALAKAEPSGDPARYLFEGLRELMFFYLFQAGERLSREADERLALEVKRRFEALGDLR